MSASRALLSPERVFSSSARISAAFSTGSVAVFTPQISTFPCIKQHHSFSKRVVLVFPAPREMIQRAALR